MLTEKILFSKKHFGFFTTPGLVKDQTFDGFYLHPSQKGMDKVERVACACAVACVLYYAAARLRGLYSYVVHWDFPGDPRLLDIQLQEAGKSRLLGQKLSLDEGSHIKKTTRSALVN